MSSHLPRVQGWDLGPQQVALLLVLPVLEQQASQQQALQQRRSAGLRGVATITSFMPQHTGHGTTAQCSMSKKMHRSPGRGGMRMTLGTGTSLK